MTRRISTKIILIFSALIAASSLAMLVFFNNLVRDIHRSIIEGEMEEKLKTVDILLDLNGGRLIPRTPGAHALASEISRVIGLRLTVVELSGLVIADSSIDETTADNHLWRKEIHEALETGVGKSTRYSGSLRADMLYYAKKTGDRIVRLAKPLHEIEESVARVRKIIIVFSCVLFAGALLITVILTRVITRPINETISFARDFASGDLARRIVNYGDDEIGQLQRALNTLADSLQDKISGIIMEQNKLSVTVQSIHEGIALIDTLKKVLLHNRAFTEILHTTPDIAGKSYYEAVRSSSLNAKIEYALANRAPVSFEEELPGGTVCEVYISPIEEERTLTGVLVVLHDVTERRRIVRLKTELVGNLSHELKTPITILKGYLETLRDHACDPATAPGLIGKALVSVERQNSIINDMLKLNMLETAPSFQNEDIDLKELAETCLGILGPRIEEKRITVTRELGTLAGPVIANRFLAEEILFNLIDNAINYNRFDGRVSVSARQLPGEIRFIVTDTGIGIPPDSLDRIFERFYRVNKSRSRATGGTGLGLSIVKHAADLLGWTIEVSSGESGSMFTIRIPSR
jgi:two-component system, OmpR family, phosphate regulon sensor histidine kinase PhoR